jgi:3-hydroxybutyryl-CoA dehydrogenase
MSIERVAVVGAGTMGHGIAQVIAASGYPVSLIDLDQTILERSMQKIQKSLERMAKAGKLTEDQVAEALGRIHCSSSLSEGCKEADLAVESVFEDIEIKKKLFAQLDENSPDDCLLVSNTSQLSVTAMASKTDRPELVAGMHWFNPPPMMKLIELVRGVNTSDETIEELEAFSKKLGKVTVVCKDSQGFISSRAFSAHLFECYRIYEEGVASKEDIDKAIKLSLGYPMGPFEISDYVGLDIIYHASSGMVEAYGDRYRPPQCLVKLVEAGHLGVKTGKGFYIHGQDRSKK